MPDTNQILQGYNLTVGNIYGKYKISNISIEEHNVVLYNEYSFPCTITFTSSESIPSGLSANEMLQIFFNSVSSVRIIDSSSGRHYKCTFSWPIGKSATIGQLNNFQIVTYTTEIYAKRVSKLEAERVNREKTW